MQFEYKARTTTGEQITGVIDAASTAAAQKMLRAKGQLLVSISKNRKSSAASANSRNHNRSVRGKRVPKHELLMLTSQLAVMLETGVEIAEAVQLTAEQATHPVLRQALQKVHADISDGQPVAEAMRKQSHVFGQTYVASVAAGEASGEMPTVLTRMADVLRGEIRFKSMIRTVMAYPVILASVSSLVLGVLMFFVLPRFGTIFHDMNVELPASTRLLLSVSESLKTHTLIWFLVLSGSVAGGITAWKSPAGKQQIDRMMLHTVVIRDISRTLIAGRAFRLLGTMLQSGVPLLEAIRLVRSSVRNSVFRSVFDTLENEVVNGGGIGRALLATSFVPSGAARMVVTAERTGRLGLVVEKVGAFYEDDGERRLNEVSKFVEPAIIIIMGTIVAFVVVSVMLPMIKFAKLS